MNVNPALARDTVKAWRSILHELRKENASVLTKPRVERSFNDVIGDPTAVNRSLRVNFMDAGKPRSIYNLFIFNAYTGTVRYSFASMSYDGIAFNDGVQAPTQGGANPVIQLPVEISELYIAFTGISGTGLHINQGVDINDGAIGPFYLLGFTIPDSERDDA